MTRVQQFNSMKIYITLLSLVRHQERILKTPGKKFVNPHDNSLYETLFMKTDLTTMDCMIWRPPEKSWPIHFTKLQTSFDSPSQFRWRRTLEFIICNVNEDGCWTVSVLSNSWRPQGLWSTMLLCLEWLAMPSSRRSSQPRDQTHVTYDSSIGRQDLYH